MSRPITYYRCDVCGQPRPRSQFNRTKSACLLCVRGETSNAQAMFRAIGRQTTKRAGRPAIMIRCPRCDTDRKTTEFNRKKTVCLMCLSNKTTPSAAVLERVYTTADHEEAARAVRAAEALNTIDRNMKEFFAQSGYEKCSCCPHSGTDVGEIPDGTTLLCELCWWSVQHVGRCTYHTGRAADPDPPVIYPERVGRVLPEPSLELKQRFSMVPPVPGPPLTPEQIAADGESEPD